MKPDLSLLKGTYAIYQLDNMAEMPRWTEKGGFLSYTETSEEVTIVCLQKDSLPALVINSELNWKILKITGPLSFNLTGIIAGVSSVLAKNKVSLFIISTFSTDYILVKEVTLNKAVKALRQNGYSITIEKELL